MLSWTAAGLISISLLFAILFSVKSASKLSEQTYETAKKKWPAVKTPDKETEENKIAGCDIHAIVI